MAGYAACAGFPSPYGEMQTMIIDVTFYTLTFDEFPSPYGEM